MEDATGRVGPSGRRIGVMVAFAIVAILAFVLLADVRLNYDDPLFDGLTPKASRLDWTIALLAVESVCLVVVLLLLLVRRSASNWVAEDWSVDAQPTSGNLIQIGCPGCGTVFEKPMTDVDEPHEQDFTCPNCGRPGHLRLGLHKSVGLRQVTCVQCQREYVAYRDGAECPHCHAAN